MTGLSTRLTALEEANRRVDHTQWVLSALRYLQGIIGLREPAPPPRQLSAAEIAAEPAALNILAVIEAAERRRA